MGALAADKPKPLIEVAGRPVIDWQVDWMKANGVDSLVFLVGRKGEKVVEHVQSRGSWGIDVEYSYDIDGADTGGAIKGAEKYLKDEKAFYIVNADTLSDIPLKKLKPGKYIVTMALANEISPYGVVRSRGTHIIEFLEKPLLRNVWVNAGYFAATPEIFEHLPERGNISLITWPKLIGMGRMGCKKFNGAYWRDIGTPKDVDLATEDIQNGKLKT